eukprot:1156184-Pelagomonas_calceolata.AAC.3
MPPVARQRGLDGNIAVVPAVSRCFALPVQANRLSTQMAAASSACKRLRLDQSSARKWLQLYAQAARDCSIVLFWLHGGCQATCWACTAFTSGIKDMLHSIVFDLSHSKGMLSTNASLVDATIARVSHVSNEEDLLPKLQARAKGHEGLCQVQHCTESVQETSWLATSPVLSTGQRWCMQVARQRFGIASGSCTAIFHAVLPSLAGLRPKP